MRSRTAIIMVILAFILQPFLSGLLPAFLTPNLLLCIVLLSAITMAEEDVIIPVILALIMSLVTDFFCNQFAGVSAVVMIVLVVPLFVVRRHINIENILFIGVLSLGLNLIYELLYWVIYRSLGSTYGLLYVISKLPMSVLPNAVLLFIGLFFFSRHVAQERRDSYFKVKRS